MSSSWIKLNLCNKRLNQVGMIILIGMQNGAKVTRSLKSQLILDVIHIQTMGHNIKIQHQISLTAAGAKA
jgi:hypothetical protein